MVATLLQALAIFAMSGGFLAPVLVSTGAGSHVALFEANAAMTMVHAPAYYATPVAKDRLRRLHAPLRAAFEGAVDRFLARAAKGEVCAAAALPPVADTFARAP